MTSVRTIYNCMNRNYKLLILIVMAVTFFACQNSKAKEVKGDDKKTKLSADTIQNQTAIEENKADTSNTTKVSNRVPLKLSINKLSSTTAPIKIAVYNSNENFLVKEGRILEFVITPQGKKASTEITELEYGTYAIVVFQDMNSSGKMDKNSIGMPSEHYGLSNNFVPKLKKPTFDDCKFNYDEKNNFVNIDLQ